MSAYSDSGERGFTDFVRFGLGFLAFMLATTGVVVASPGFAVFGGAVLLLIIASFYSED